MRNDVNRRWVMAARPVGEPKREDFRLEEPPIPTPGEGEVLLRTRYLSLDPYMRGRMNAGTSYAAAMEIGDTMVGRTVSEVVTSRHPDFRAGDAVLASAGWQTFAISKGNDLKKLDPAGAPLTAALGVLGMPGLTAYAGLLRIGDPKPGETVVVAAATGAVGALVGQIAKIKGARAVGIAGGPAKCRALIEEFGFDAAVDHRDPALPEKLAAACPKGIDVYFENVGGLVLRAVEPLLNTFARIPVCGLIAHYNDTASSRTPGPSAGFLRAVLTKRLTLRGFIVGDFADMEPAFQRDMADWLRQGKVKYREEIVDGLEKAPEAFIGLLKGRNFGKLIVKVG